MLSLIKYLRPWSGYLLVVYILSIIIISTMPGIPTLKIHTAKVEIRLDYLLHLCEYGALAVLTYMSFAGESYRITFRKYFILTFLLVVFSLADEFHQKLVPGRSFNVNDIYSNLAGVAAGLVFCIFVFRRLAGKVR